MKTYLEDLKNALLKMNVNEDKINEILSDMEEMIASAKEEGISDDDIKLKFGNPEKLASELAEIEPKVNKPTEETDEDKTYVFEPTSKMLSVLTRLTNDNVTYYQVDSSQIKVILKEQKTKQKYKITYENDVLKIENDQKLSLFFGVSFSRSSNDVIVEIPSNMDVQELNHKTVNGDLEIKLFKVNSLKVNSTEGDMVFKDINAQECNIHTVNGDLTVEKSQFNNIQLSTVSGDTTIDDTQITTDLTFHTVSGDFNASNTEASTLYFQAVSGDANGRNLYIKKLSFDSISGDCSIDNDRKEHIEIIRQKTLSGDINIK
ncbi:MAG: DUF1700 domain-containing protein [Bacillota bacterium]|nr:MAG: DUF1700 domain-containing protein [Bacillota bacterium]